MQHHVVNLSSHLNASWATATHHKRQQARTLFWSCLHDAHQTARQAQQ
jgi:hypothetical protein